MKIPTSKLREFFRRTGKLEEQTWDSNVLIEKPKLKTIQPDERLDYTKTFEHINKQLTK